jgi:C_GCAxxG_C_C family probable redox protein
MEIHMDRVEEAVNCIKSGFLCSQAILSTYGKEFGLDVTMANKIACGFGAGMSRIGATCGAVSGAFMVIGLKHGKCTASDNDSKEKTYRLVQQFVSEFIQRNKSTKCTDLLGLDLGNPEDYEKAKDRGLFMAICPKLVKDAAEILEDILRKK